MVQGRRSVLLNLVGPHGVSPHPLSPRQWFKGAESKFVEPYGARRKPGQTNLTLSPDHGPSTTVHALLRESCRKHARFNAMGTRTFLGMHKSDKAPFPLKVFGDTTWKTYQDLGDDSAAFGRGLRSLGMQPLPIELSDAVTSEFVQMKGKRTPGAPRGGGLPSKKRRGCRAALRRLFSIYLFPRLSLSLSQAPTPSSSSRRRAQIG